MKETQEEKPESFHSSKSQLDLSCWVSGVEHPPTRTAKGLWVESSPEPEGRGARPERRSPAAGVRVKVV